MLESLEMSSPLGTMPFDIRDAAVARRSARVKPWQLTLVREVIEEDMVVISSASGFAPDPRAPLATIRDPHHTLARLVAAGEPNVKIAAVTGYSPGRISTLKNDPAFLELVHHYEMDLEEIKSDVTMQLRHASLTAMQILQERLENEPESFKNKELQDLAMAGFDRTGNGPKSTTEVNLNDPTKVVESLATIVSQQMGRVLSRKEIEAEYTEISHEPSAEGDGIEVGKAGP